MGKASKKVAKKQQGNKLNEQQKTISEIKVKLNEYKADGKYEEALLLVIDLLERECYDTDVVFAAAELYFMAGDYARANIWIDRTLEAAPAHLGARILLTRICMMGDRADAGLGILEVVLKIGKGRLTTAQKEEVEELLEYYKYTKEEAEISGSYPNVAELMGFAGAIAAGKEDSRAGDMAELCQEPASHTQVSAALDVVETGAGEKEKDIETVRQEILEKNISLQEKIVLCNSFAGAYYYADRIADAKIMLLTANSLDAFHTETLHNLALLAAEAGDQDMALQYVTKMPHTDFSLLKSIKAYAKK